MPRWIKTWLILWAAAFVVFMAAILIRHEAFNLATVFIISAVAATWLFGLWRLIRWLGCWRNLRRALFGLVCLATLGALFFAEEDWRGRHEWDVFQREAETRGEYFDLARVTPPPVPEDQNFALTPVVASSYDWIIDRTGHALPSRKSEAGNRLGMYYLAPNYDMNLELSGWTIGQRTDLTSLQQYYRTLSAKTNLFPVTAQPQSPAADVLLALSRFDNDIADVRQAAQLPYSRFPLEYDKDNPFEIFLPHLAALKRCTITLALRTTAELQTGQTDRAMENLRLIQYLTESVHSEPFLITHLVRVAMTQLMLQPVWEGLADHRWTDAQLTELDAGLAKLDFLADYQYSLRNEQAAMVKGMDYLRRHPDQYNNLGEGWGWNPPIYPTTDFIMSWFAECRMIPSGWFYQNQLRYDRVIDEFYLPSVDRQKGVFLPAPAKQGEAFMKNEYKHLSPYNIVGCIITAYLEGLHYPTSFAHGQSSVDLARVALALERYRLAQGKYPDSLEALAPQFMGSVPHDVIGGQSLHYRLTEDGQFVLYSVGWNETDDGGVVVLNHDTPSTQDYSQGDWVWRYPAK